MIKSLKHRVQEELNNLSSELELIGDANTKGNYFKLLESTNMHQKRIRDLSLEIDNQKTQLV